MTLRIAARPYDFDLEAERTALLIIDMQRDFLEWSNPLELIHL